MYPVCLSELSGHTAVVCGLLNPQNDCTAIESLYNKT